jgi:hypothetical protein
MIVINYLLMYYMNKFGNKFTVKFAISSQKQHLGCELIVNQNASYALNNSNMSVNLINKQGIFHVTNSVFVRSLFALCSLTKRRNSVYTVSLKRVN